MSGFHRSLRTRGVGARDWSNPWTEHEYLGKDEEGKHKFRVALNVENQVFKDFTDGEWKKLKLTDNRPDHVLIQNPSCCAEIYPYYATFYDSSHQEVRLEEERWVVQRLFEAPDTWMDVGAYNPLISVENSGEEIKVTVSYDTDYGSLIVEYVMGEFGPLKHNIFFNNSSSKTETFRALQRWSGIKGEKVNDKEITQKRGVQGHNFTFRDTDGSFSMREGSWGLMGQGVKDILEMHTGSRERVVGETIVFERDNVKLSARGDGVHLVIDGEEVMNNSVREMSIMVASVEECPDNARAFIGGLGLGVVLHALMLSRKATEVIVCDNNQTVIDEIFPLIQNYLPHLNLSIITGDATVEVTKNGKFDWIFMDFPEVFKENVKEKEAELMEASLPYLTDRGVYTAFRDISKLPLKRVPYLRSVEVDVHPNGLKSDFIYGDWTLSPNKSLEIDPDTFSTDNPNEDGDLEKDFSNGSYAAARAGCLADAPARDSAGANISFGGVASDFRGSFNSKALRGYIEWDISAFPGGTITDVDLKYEGQVQNDTSGEINPLTDEAPSGATDANLWGYIASGVAYVDPFTVVVAANQTQDLGAACDTDLQTAVDAAQSWFAIGFQSPDDECPSASSTLLGGIYSEDFVGPPTPKPTLFVTFTPAGWSGKIAGVTDPAEIGGVAVADIESVKSVE